jgi:3-hydroxyisobutyrate dehydrogenase-like beta-hydroxyacid dehydrogenase
VNALVRRPAQMKHLQAFGVAPTMNISDLSDSEIIISMLPDDDVVRDVFFGGRNGTDGIATRLAPGAIHLSMSTISTAAASEFERAHQRLEQGYVAAPVFGNPDAAKAQQLSIIVAGLPDHCQRCRPLIESLGQIGPPLQQPYAPCDPRSDPHRELLLPVAIGSVVSMTRELFAVACAVRPTNSRRSERA